MTTPISSILCYLVAAIIGALGQYLYKTGADEAKESLLSYLVNWRILIGVACYVGVMVLFVAGFKLGGQPNVLYPLYASTFVWSAVITYFAFGKAITPINVAGMVLLVAGMYLMGRES